ncbi:MAG: D-glycero-beta-D-manno-heptose-7-phosphate kinase [Polyangiaceae bacterium]
MTSDLSASVARSAVESMRGKHVVVFGDLMLDEFLQGDVSRISPEAPVPVVELQLRELRPGGAANAAANLVSLGASCTVLGRIGTDAAGASLLSCLTTLGVDGSHAFSEEGRPTTHKLRVVARSQQMVRVDSETTEPLGREGREKALAAVQALAPRADGWIISDYAKGCVTSEITQAIIAAAKARAVPVIVDPKGKDYTKYRGATVITPNTNELDVAAGFATKNDDEAIVRAGAKLEEVLGDTAVLATRGAKGMTLMQKGAAPFHFPTKARSVFDVTGAGDTVVATLALALSAKLPWPSAISLASHAAGVAVSKPGTVAVTAEELMAAFD